MASLHRFSRFSAGLMLSSRRILPAKVADGQAASFNRCAQCCYSSLRSEAIKDDFYAERLSGDQEGITVFTFNRPKAKNAISKNVANQFRESIEAVKHDKSVRVVILRSAVPNIFCAGADLKERLQMPPEEVGPFVSGLRALLSGIAALPMPTIAALDGAALGGGLEIALACDFRLAASNAKLGLVETKLAIIPGAGGTQRLTRIVGIAQAKRLIFSAKILNGHEAAKIGLVEEAVEQSVEGDAAYHAAVSLAEQILPQGPLAVRMAKAAINGGIETDIATGLALEESYYAQVIPTKDRIEGLKAFSEKRKPMYTGN
ncbi:Methylglutaconyl-CoA hydratase, mitochondrial [Trichoplax sp. H2]|nr:Methylglutaconyl-CoA hydratase, mitochondrial [Trichoplax sp. H2]|eukprot:RDD36650.1 Methylglutaconyl-CoA hydratase, mitochondrial [Trichoplax sp. H2]